MICCNWKKQKFCGQQSWNTLYSRHEYLAMVKQLYMLSKEKAWRRTIPLEHVPFCEIAMMAEHWQRDWKAPWNVVCQTFHSGLSTNQVPFWSMCPLSRILTFEALDTLHQASRVTGMKAMICYSRIVNPTMWCASFHKIRGNSWFSGRHPRKHASIGCEEYRPLILETWSPAKVSRRQLLGHRVERRV